jgi:hypothetical protein
MRVEIERTGTYLMAVVLIGAAAAKVVWLVSVGSKQPEIVRMAYVVFAFVETCLGTCILWPRTRSFGLSMTFWGFIGGGAVSAVLVALKKDVGTCHCLGVPVMSQGTALLLQGAVILIAGWVLALRHGSSG